MSKITYYLYYSEDEPYGINACLDGEHGTQPCAYMNFSTSLYGKRVNFERSWKFPGKGNSMYGIVGWDKARAEYDNVVNKPGEFITACQVRRLFKKHGIDLSVVPPSRGVE